MPRRIIVDRVDNKPNTYLIDGEEVEIVKVDDGVVEFGTNVNAELLQRLEDINTIENDSGVNYKYKLKLVAGKPVIEYEEV
jgi:hypothetical protein